MNIGFSGTLQRPTGAGYFNERKLDPADRLGPGHVDFADPAASFRQPLFLGFKFFEFLQEPGPVDRHGHVGTTDRGHAGRHVFQGLPNLRDPLPDAFKFFGHLLILGLDEDPAASGAEDLRPGDEGIFDAVMKSAFRLAVRRADDVRILVDGLASGALESLQADGRLFVGFQFFLTCCFLAMISYYLVFSEAAATMAKKTMIIGINTTPKAIGPQSGAVTHHQDQPIVKRFMLEKIAGK